MAILGALLPLSFILVSTFSLSLFLLRLLFTLFAFFFPVLHLLHQFLLPAGSPSSSFSYIYIYTYKYISLYINFFFFAGVCLVDLLFFYRNAVDVGSLFFGRRRRPGSIFHANDTFMAAISTFHIFMGVVKLQKKKEKKKKKTRQRTAPLAADKITAATNPFGSAR